MNRLFYTRDLLQSEAESMKHQARVEQKQYENKMQEFRRLKKVKERMLLEEKVRESKGDYGAVSEAKMNSSIKRK